MLQGYNEKRDSLSKRQLRVIQGRSLGLNNEKLAELLECTPSTITEHKRRAYAKIRCHTENESIKWLEKSGYSVTLEQFTELCTKDIDPNKNSLFIDDKQKEIDRVNDFIDNSLAEGYKQAALEFNRGIYG